MEPFTNTQILPAGKLPPQLLDRLLSRIPGKSRRLLTGPGVGEDAAVISFGASSLIAKADPVTFATDLIGWYAVHVNANDIAATGATPKWFMPTVLLPEGTDVGTVDAIFSQILDAATSIGVELIGGHTEISVGMPRPVISGAMLGEAPASETLSTAGSRPGDHIILTGGIAIEGGSLLAREFRDRALAAGVTEKQVETASTYLFDPGISVIPEARIAVSSGTVTSMHDPTEGGLAGALAELHAASGNGLVVEEEKVSILNECSVLCDALGVDPWGLIASGSLLITCTPGTSQGIVEELRSEGIMANVIGRMTERGSAAQVMRTGGDLQPLPRFARDEIARLFTETT